MRFHFCGDLDCPDWVLAEISTLSKLSSIKVKLLCGHVIKDLLGEPIDFDKVKKLTSDAKFDFGDVKASIAVISLIVSNAAKFDVSGDVLSNELQQLGLPKEHATVIVKAYEDCASNMRLQLLRKSLRLSSLEAVNWRVDYVLGSSLLKEINEPFVQLQLKVRNPDDSKVESLAFSLTAEKFQVFLSELKQAYEIVSNLSV